MAGSILVLAVIAVVVCLVAFCLYVPVYKGYINKRILQALILQTRLTEVSSRLGERLNIDSYVNIRRRIGVYFDWICPCKSSNVDQTKINSSDDVFEGVAVRVYRPSERKSLLPGIVFYHGGGWMFGNLDSYDDVVRDLAYGVNAIVVSVDYRLAPEHKFPVPLEDCVKATVYVLHHAKELGVDPDRIALAGDSAGGNLAAAASLKIKTLDVPKPCAQILLYPELQTFDYGLPSRQQNMNDPFLPLDNVARSCAFYAEGNCFNMDKYMRNEHVPPKLLQDLKGHCLNHNDIPDKLTYPPYTPPPASPAASDPDVWQQIQNVFKNPLFNPLISEDLSGLPAAYIVTAEYDVLRDDGFLYARRLSQAGVKVIHDHLDIGFHDAGFFYGTTHGDRVPELKEMQQLEYRGIKQIISPSNGRKS